MGVHSGFIELVRAKVRYLLDLVVLSALINAGFGGFQVALMFLPAKILLSSGYWLVFSSLLFFI